jgi:hypothetical protein
MRTRLAILAALLSAATFGWRADAATFNFSFTGPDVSGLVQLTYGTATDTEYPWALEVTATSGTFSDSNSEVNIVNPE